MAFDNIDIPSTHASETETESSSAGSLENPSYQANRIVNYSQISLQACLPPILGNETMKDLKAFIDHLNRLLSDYEKTLSNHLQAFLNKALLEKEFDTAKLTESLLAFQRQCAIEFRKYQTAFNRLINHYSKGEQSHLRDFFGQIPEIEGSYDYCDEVLAHYSNQLAALDLMASQFGEFFVTNRIISLKLQQNPTSANPVALTERLETLECAANAMHMACEKAAAKSKKLKKAQGHLQKAAVNLSFPSLYQAHSTPLIHTVRRYQQNWVNQKIHKVRTLPQKQAANGLLNVVGSFRNFATQVSHFIELVKQKLGVIPPSAALVLPPEKTPPSSLLAEVPFIAQQLSKHETAMNQIEEQMQLISSITTLTQQGIRQVQADLAQTEKITAEFREDFEAYKQESTRKYAELNEKQAQFKAKMGAKSDKLHSQSLQHADEMSATNDEWYTQSLQRADEMSAINDEWYRQSLQRADGMGAVNDEWHRQSLQRADEMSKKIDKLQAQREQDKAERDEKFSKLEAVLFTLQSHLSLAPESQQLSPVQSRKAKMNVDDSPEQSPKLEIITSNSDLETLLTSWSQSDSPGKSHQANKEPSRVDTPSFFEQAEDKKLKDSHLSKKVEKKANTESTEVVTKPAEYICR